MAPQLPQALVDWATALGSAHVVVDDSDLTGAGIATFQTTAKVRAILRPGSRAEVQAAVRIANHRRVPIYPVSSGKNWGYGSRAPVRDAVLLDLSRLNGIREYNPELAYVTIEPGVTQRQLTAFLEQQGRRHWMDATGASPDCSIIGNTLERGFGHTPMGDHAGNACAFEVVLPNGDSITTGFGQFEGARTAAVSRSGVGPSLDGLFLQSSLGIVTSMTVWLMPAPEHFEAFFFLSDDPAALGPIVDALRPLRLDGTLRSVMHIGNDYKVLAASGGFPWAKVNGAGAVGEVAMAELRQAHGIAAWSGSGGLYGTRAQVREAKRLVKRALAGKVDQLQFMNDRRLELLERFAAPVSWIMRRDVGRLLKILRPVYGLLKGQPTDSTLTSAYWRKRTPAPAKASLDPDRDGCGLLWCSPVVPMQGAAMAEVATMALRVLLDAGFEPQMSISLATERMAICVVTITYDRAEAGADERAMRCYRTLAGQLQAAGYPLYRRNISAMDLAAETPAYAELLRELKSTLDPNGILAPGRYEPATAVPQAGISQKLA